MLAVAATIPDAAARDQFADRLAHKARITESVVRDEIRRAAAQKKTVAPASAVPATSRVRLAEQGLLWALVHRPVEAMAAVARLEPEDLDGLLTAPVFRLAAGLLDMPPDLFPDLLAERLSEGERVLLDRAASSPAPAAAVTDCVNTFRRLRVDRERAAVQQEIDRLQERSEMTDSTLVALWERKKKLLRQLEELN